MATSLETIQNLLSDFIKDVQKATSLNPNQGSLSNAEDQKCLLRLSRVYGFFLKEYQTGKANAKATVTLEGEAITPEKGMCQRAK